MGGEVYSVPLGVEGRVAWIFARLKAVEGGVDEPQGIEAVFCSRALFGKKLEAELEAFPG